MVTVSKPLRLWEDQELHSQGECDVAPRLVLSGLPSTHLGEPSDSGFESGLGDEVDNLGTTLEFGSLPLDQVRGFTHLLLRKCKSYGDLIKRTVQMMQLPISQPSLIVSDTFITIAFPIPTVLLHHAKDP